MPPVTITRLQYERLRRGWSQLVLGYKARVANTDISRWERGRGVPYEAQGRRVARVLHVQPHELLEPVEITNDDGYRLAPTLRVEARRARR